MVYSADAFDSPLRDDKVNAWFKSDKISKKKVQTMD